MSVIFDVDNFDRTEQIKIAKMLTFIPESDNNNFDPNRSRFSQPKKTGEIVKMYYCKDKKLYLPYRFACCYFDKFFNQDIKFPRIFKAEDGGKEGKFSGKLLDRQVEPFAEVMQQLKEYRTATIALYPGFGKTFMGAMLAWKLNYKTCVLVHRDNVGKQWVKTFRNYFDLPDKDICYVDDKLNKEAKIFVCMARRTDKIPPEIRSQIGVLIIDEAHCFCSPGAVKPMLAFSPRYTIAETATPQKENGMFKVIQSMCGEHFIQKISTKPYFFFLIQTNLAIPVDAASSNNIFNDVLVEQCTSEKRNTLIGDILEHNQHYKTIIATPRTEHCEILKKEAEDRGLETSELYGTKKSYIPKNILIGTCSKMGVGFDEANFCDDFDGRPSDLLIMCQTFKSWAPFEQVRGRGMRAEKPNVIMFNDQHSITKRHFTQIRKWVKETNGIVVEMNVDDIESFNIEAWKMKRLEKLKKKMARKKKVIP